MFDVERIKKNINRVFGSFSVELEVTGDTALVMYGLKENCETIELQATEESLALLASKLPGYANMSPKNKWTVIMTDLSGNIGNMNVEPFGGEVRPCMFVDGLRVIHPETLLDHHTGMEPFHLDSYHKNPSGHLEDYKKLYKFVVMGGRGV